MFNCEIMLYLQENALYLAYFIYYQYNYCFSTKGFISYYKHPQTDVSIMC